MLLPASTSGIRFAIAALLGIAAAPAALLAQSAPRIPVFFTENRGQWPGEVRYAGNTAGFAAAFHDDRVVLTRTSEKGSATVELAFVGARARPEGEELLRARVSYFVGDAASWRSNLATCAAVRYRELWPGVDVRFYENAGALEYDVILAPGAELESVAFLVAGAAALDVESGGALRIHTALGELLQAAPRTWEVGEDGSQIPLPCRFELRGTTRFGFRADARDASRRLVVDPVLVWGTYFGSTGSESNPPALAVDATGCVYLAGTTVGSAPTTAGAFRVTNPGSTNGVIAKLDPRLSGSSQLIWCTYLGGFASDGTTSIALTLNGDVVIGGWTDSANFPTSANALDVSLGGVSQAGTVSVLSSDGATLQYGTYLKGSASTFGAMTVKRVAVDSSGMIIAAGETNMANMPTSPGAYQPSLSPSGNYDFWLGRLDSTQIGSAQLLWGTYYGGAGLELLRSVAVSATYPGVLTFCGYTNLGSSFPSSHATGTLGATDAVIGQLDMLATGPAQRRFAHVISYATLATDDANAFIEEAGGRILLLAQLGGLVRILRLSSDGSTILTDRALSTGSAAAADIMLSADGTITATGFAVTGVIPVTLDAFQSVAAGNFDVWICQLDSDLAQILYATYAGGSAIELLNPGGSFLRENRITVACMSESTDMPLANAYQGTHGGGTRDLHILRIDLPHGAEGGVGPRDLALLDLDADGDLDAATANEGSDDLSLRTNDGLGTLGAEATVALTTADDAPVALASCDLDGDGARDDLAVACETSSTLVLITAPASASPSTVSLSLLGQRASCVATGDLDADPRDDCAVGMEGLPFSGGGGLALVRNGSPAVAIAMPPGHPTQVARVALGDLDGDLDLDLVALVRGGSDEILLFAGDGSGALAFAGALPLASSGLASSLALGDFDRDGRNDLAAVQPSLFPPSQSLRIYRRTSAGPLSAALFASGVDHATSGALAIDLASGDLEDDSVPGFHPRTELVHANAGDGSVTVRGGFDGASFASSSSPSAGTNPVAVAIGDLNGDGGGDLVVANQGSSDLTVVLSTPPQLAQSYGSSCGGPLLSALSLPTLGNASFAVELTGGRAFAPALFFFSIVPADIPLPPSACRLYLSAPLSSALRFTNGTGRAVLPIGIPSWSALLGVDLYFQGAVFRSPGGAFENTLDLSDALRLQVGQ